MGFEIQVSNFYPLTIDDNLNSELIYGKRVLVSFIKVTFLCLLNGHRYWTNNNSRMYVFENTGKMKFPFGPLSLQTWKKWCITIYRFFNVTGDFVRQSGVEVGDSIHLYEDKSKNLVSYTHTLIWKLNKEIRMIEFCMHRELVIKLPLHLLITLTVSFGLE